MKKAHCYLLLIIFFHPGFIVLYAENSWKHDIYEVFVNHDNMLIKANQKELVQINSIAFNHSINQEFKIDKNTPDKLTIKLIYKKANCFFDELDKEVLLEITGVDGGLRFYANPDWAQHVTVNLSDNNNSYFGLLEKLYPDNLRSPDLKGNVIPIEVNSTHFEYAENYASVHSAFFISSAGFGGFFDTFAYGEYKLGIKGQTSLYHWTGKLDWYIFYGPEGDKIHQSYYKLIGKPKYVPLWACGPTIWRDENKGGKDEILADIKKFTDHKIPVTAWFVDRPYSNGNNEWSKMDFNDKFANPEQWIKEINTTYGIEFMTWIGSCTFGDTVFPRPLMPGYNRYMDLSDTVTVAEFNRRLTQNQYQYGVKGHKMDRADENFPNFGNEFADGTPGYERRNKYPYLFAKVSDEILRETWKNDQFNFARASFHRSQPYLGAVWGGDVRKSWGGVANNIANALRCGYMGFPVWGTDVGGYLGTGKIDEELYARWLQWGTWNGMYEIKIDGAGGNGAAREPWRYSEKLQKQFREACVLRMKLLPYIFSMNNTSYKNGVGMKPLSYVFPDDKNTYQIWDEYMFGDAFLVAPIYEAGNKRNVYLPEGGWYDFNHPETRYEGGKTIEAFAPEFNIPVFIRENTIYVTGSLSVGNTKIWDKTIENNPFVDVYIFPVAKDEAMVFDYVDYADKNTEKKIIAQRSTNKLKITIPSLSTSGKCFIYVVAQPKKVLINGNKAKYAFTQGSVSVAYQKQKNSNITMIW